MRDKLVLLLATAMLVSVCASCSSDTTEVEEDADVADATVEATVETDDDAEEADEATYVYATMNIPYSDFYAAELTDNDFEVDAVTSATTSKWSMKEWNYSEALPDGSGGGMIYGPKYPVLITEELFDELSALGETEDYYVTALDETPVAYKEVTDDGSGNLTFSETITDSITVLAEGDDGYEYAMSYPSSWGDFELEIDGLPDADAVYAATVVTDSGKSYGLRYQENIWFQAGEISWSLGYKDTEAKGNPLSGEQYADMQGSTITEIIYYTSDGLVICEMDVYVPYLFCASWFSIGEGSTAVYEDYTTTINYVDGVEAPADYEKTLGVKNSAGEYVDGFTVSDDFSTISWTEDVAPGSYTVEISDASGVYMVYAAKVTLQSTNIPVDFDANSLSFDAATGASDDAFDAYIAGITKYTVYVQGEEEGTSYSVSESHGTPGTPLFAEDGTIDLAAVNSSDEAVYEAGVTYTIAITVTGYVEYTFDFTA